MNIELDIRTAWPSDLNFVKQSYLLRLRNSPQYKMLSNDVFFQYFNPVIDYICENAEILVAVNVCDGEQIYGYLITEDTTILNIPTIHMIYVKSTFRNFGVATQLLDCTVPPKLSTFTSPEGEKLLLKAFDNKVNCFYNPFIFASIWSNI